MIITQKEQIKVLKEVIKCNKRRIKSVKEAKRRNDGVQIYSHYTKSIIEPKDYIDMVKYYNKILKSIIITIG